SGAGGSARSEDAGDARPNAHTSTRRHGDAQPNPHTSTRRHEDAGSQPTVCSRLLVSVGDPTAIEVVRRELDLDPVAGQDADVVAPHLARDVAEHLVPVVELDLEHRVREGLDDLALHLDLLFLRQSACDPSGWDHEPPPERSLQLADVDRLRPLVAGLLVIGDLRVLLQRLEAVALDAGVVDEQVAVALIGRDEAEPLLVVEPLHGTGCHLAPILRLLSVLAVFGPRATTYHHWGTLSQSRSGVLRGLSRAARRRSRR